MRDVGGMATILGETYRFPRKKGYGLIEFKGEFFIVKFSCRFEAMPPTGAGQVVASNATINLVNGGFTYEGQELQVGERVLRVEEMKP